MHSTFFAFFFNLNHHVKLVSHFPVLHFRSCISSPAFSVLRFPVRHFPVLHFPTLEICSLIFQSYRSVFDLFGPSLVIHFPVLHFQSIRRASLFVQIHVKLPFNFVIIFDL